MKNLSVFFILLVVFSGFKEKPETIALKTFAEEAMTNSLIGSDPIIVISEVSAKIYSKVDLGHPVFNNLNREGLFIIPKNTDITDELWGQRAKDNGVIVYKEAQQLKPNMKNLRYVLNGRELSRSEIDTVDLKKVKDFIVVKSRLTDQCVAFFYTQ